MVDFTTVHKQIVRACIMAILELLCWCKKIMTFAGFSKWNTIVLSAMRLLQGQQ